LARPGIRRISTAVGAMIFIASQDSTYIVFNPRGHRRHAGVGEYERGWPSKSQLLRNLDNFRPFATGSGIHALFNRPSALLYIAVIFRLHPLLGGFAHDAIAMLAAERYTSRNHQASRANRRSCGWRGGLRTAIGAASKDATMECLRSKLRRTRRNTQMAHFEQSSLPEQAAVCQQRTVVTGASFLRAQSGLKPCEPLPVELKRPRRCICRVTRTYGWALVLQTIDRAHRTMTIFSSD
jgi:hypothetical protein